MQPELSIPLALLVAAAVTYLVTPLAIRVARATGFMDEPAGYKGHGNPTPYLGGSAILAGVLIAGLAFGPTGRPYAVLGVCALVLWVVGTMDDPNQERTGPEDGVRPGGVPERERGDDDAGHDGRAAEVGRRVAVALIAGRLVEEAGGVRDADRERGDQVGHRRCDQQCERDAQLRLHTRRAAGRRRHTRGR